MTLRFFLAILIFITAWQASAAEPNRNLGITATGEKRVALVIGNGKYPAYPLKNPANDARDMAAALRSIGFDVIEKTDVAQKEMNRAIAQFGSKLSVDTVALFFYAGHGIQVRGKNYLIPIDAQIESENSVRAETVDVDTLLDQLSASPLNVVILDACRNNPFERRFRSVGGGLAQMDAPKGTLIAYATSPGKVASDGEGRNGLYTQELLKIIQTPGLPVEQAFKKVRANVARATRDNQIPWEASSLTGDFYFSPSQSQATSLPSQPRPSIPEERNSALAQEIAFWESVKDSRNPVELKAYLNTYPGGQFQGLALARINTLDERPTEIISTAGTLPTPAKIAKIYVIRPFRLAGALGLPDMSLDDQPLGELPNGTYLTASVLPRKYTLIGKGAFYTFKKDIDLSPGGIFYFGVDTGPLVISLLNEAEGKAALADATLAKTAEQLSTAVSILPLPQIQPSEDKIESVSPLQR